MVEFNLGDATIPSEQYLLMYKANCDLKFLEHLNQKYSGDEEIKAALFHCKVFLGREHLQTVSCVICHPIDIIRELEVIREKTEGFHCAEHSDVFHVTRDFFSTAYCCDRYHPDKRFRWHTHADSSATSRAQSPQERV